MSKFTILLISPTHLSRVDLRVGRSPKVDDIWIRPSVDSGSLGTLVDTALRLGKNRKRKTFVATTRCWSGNVSVAAELIRDTSDEERSQTIALEAEPFSGISAFDGMSAERPLPPTSAGDQRYWVTQISGGELREIDSAVRTAGGRLMGVAHPAVPFPNAPTSADEAWQSLQSWDGTTLATRGNGEAIADMLTITSNLQSGRTQQELNDFFPLPKGTDTSVTKQWYASEPFPPALASLPFSQDLETYDLTTETDLARWAIAWIQQQQATSLGLPTIQVPKKPLSIEAAVAIAAFLGLITMGLCTAHFWHLRSELTTHEATIAKAKELAEQLKQDKSRLKKIEEQSDQLDEEIASKAGESLKLQNQLIVATKLIQDRRSRWLKLVDTVVDVGEQTSWVNEILGDGNRVTLSGLAVDDASVHRLATAISRSLRNEGWNALPADTDVDEESQLIRFQIELTASEPLSLN